MKLQRPPRSPTGEPITALIDVVFFLLVFFMLIGRMDATAPFEVTPPTAQSGQDLPAGGATLSVSVEGALALDGTELTEADLDASLRAKLASAPGLQLRINAHQAAELRRVLPLVSRAEELGFDDIVLVVSPGREVAQ
ncbi:ExbD/TolR family protein [Tritonibacter horizontis]|uniref:Biopolymer transport protein ExbD/TolR n=1 Tax=Tritonibacter horizontis TaxID=1768241 RepID=A0A132C008_9RHOB|nr:biopolymer transporter ExbD [Tritonibacter horizontis]KUP93928.1 biopolymer transport protein ExbD/TolR [Tritonibacter horizontis]